MLVALLGMDTTMAGCNKKNRKRKQTPSPRSSERQRKKRRRRTDEGGGDKDGDTNGLVNGDQDQPQCLKMLEDVIVYL